MHNMLLYGKGLRPQQEVWRRGTAAWVSQRETTPAKDKKKIPHLSRGHGATTQLTFLMVIFKDM